MNEIFLAKIVSFDDYSLLFDINNLEPFTEEYRLIKIFENSRAYDLQNSKKYYMLNVVNDLIVDEDLGKIKPNVKYVYKKIPFLEIYESFKELNIGEDNFLKIINICIKDVDELDSILSSDEKIVNISKIRQLIRDRKL